MALPVNALIQAAHEFLREQDSSSAATRYAALLVRLKEAREYLRCPPRKQPPARFLEAHSAQGQAMAARAMAVAAAHGVPKRELIVKPYVLLYAHGNDRVVLLW